jgi:hypothetical protein
MVPVRHRESTNCCAQLSTYAVAQRKKIMARNNHALAALDVQVAAPAIAALLLKASLRRSCSIAINPVRTFILTVLFVGEYYAPRQMLPVPNLKVAKQGRVGRRRTTGFYKDSDISELTNGFFGFGFSLYYDLNRNIGEQLLVSKEQKL